MTSPTRQIPTRRDSSDKGGENRAINGNDATILGVVTTVLRRL
ncbi:hypothetical protein [Streptomyces sp. 7N604]